MIYASTSCLKSNSLSEILQIYNLNNIKNVELGFFPKLDDNYKKIVSEYDFNYVVHHYFPPPKKSFIINLASTNSKILKRSLEQIFKSIDFCHDFEIDLFSFHAGFRGDPDMNFKFSNLNVPKYSRSYNIFKESVEIIADYATNYNVKLAIENNVLSEKNLVDNKNAYLLMCEAWEFKKLFNDLEYNNIGLLLDTGHLKVTSNSLCFDSDEFIHKIEDRVFALHLHENDGKIDQHSHLYSGKYTRYLYEKYFKKSQLPIVLESKYDNIKELHNDICLLKSL